MKLQTASLSFNAQGTPTSTEFDDVYFSNQNGLEESKYVFFDHNSLNSRFFSHKNSSFVIVETGFGTGLNFLLTAQFFLDYLDKRDACNTLQRLYFVTTEKFPINKDELKKALEQWPQLATLSEQLLVQYPILTPGCHRLSFADQQIILDLWLGDVTETFKNTHIYPDGLVDAWYLDGFAPSKNPDMWQPELFAQMARLSKPDATLATFTAAGIVKRGLKSNGFVLKKVKGFGKKRDMLTGYYAPEEAWNRYVEQGNPTEVPEVPIRHKPEFEKSHSGPWQRLAYQHTATGNSEPPEIAIVGAGLAGASSALALTRKGFKCRIYCADTEPAMGASGNHIGGFYPSLNADFSLQSQFYCHAFDYARRFYSNISQRGFDFDHDWCGVFFPAFSEEVKNRQANLLKNDIWPNDLVRSVDPEQATRLCNLPMPYEGLFVADGGWINPSQCVRAMIKAAIAAGCEIHIEKQLLSLEQVSGNNSKNWQLNWQDGKHIQTDMVVFATGAQSPEQSYLADIPFTRTRGQVEYLPQVTNGVSPDTVICHKGYFTPFNNGKQAMGATFDKRNLHTQVTQQDSTKNWETIKKALPSCDWVNELPESIEQRAAIRCSLPDHRPIMGAVPDIEAQKVRYGEMYKARPLHTYPLPESKGLYVLTGLGSHGLCTAPLLSEALACQISGEPLPLGNELLASLSPNRFLIRDLIRQRI